MKKKNIIIGTGISIVSIIGGYYLTRYGARKYIGHHVKSIYENAVKQMELAYKNDSSDRSNVIVEAMREVDKFIEDHKFLCNIAWPEEYRNISLKDRVIAKLLLSIPNPNKAK